MAHRKTVLHYHEPGHLHEFTFSCYRRRPLLTNDDWRERLSRCIDAAGQETRIDLVAFVFMPEHVHLLGYPTEPEPKLSLYLARIKQPFSKALKEVLVEQHSPLLPRLIGQERPGRCAFGSGRRGRDLTGMYSPPKRFRPH